MHLNRQYEHCPAMMPFPRIKTTSLHSHLAEWIYMKMELGPSILWQVKWKSNYRILVKLLQPGGCTWWFTKFSSNSISQQGPSLNITSLIYSRTKGEPFSCRWCRYWLNKFQFHVCLRYAPIHPPCRNPKSVGCSTLKLHQLHHLGSFAVWQYQWLKECPILSRTNLAKLNFTGTCANSIWIIIPSTHPSNPLIFYQFLQTSSN